MTWTASLGTPRDNSVPNGSVYLPVTFSDDAGRSFTREYKLTAGQFGSADDIATFVANEVDQLAALYDAAAQLENATALKSTPRVVTNFQARAALMAIGLFDQVDAYCKATGGATLQAWEYANNFYRNGALVNGLAPVFGLTPEQVDELFRQAAQIEA